MTNQEYNLTIMDIDWEDGQEYMIQIGRKDPFRVVVFRGELSLVDDDGCMGEEITRCYTLEEIALANFERCIDWASVPIDTKILVGGRYHELEKRHFAKYEDGKIYAWQNGWTSWTVPSSGDYTSAWDFAKLVEED